MTPQGNYTKSGKSTEKLTTLCWYISYGPQNTLPADTSHYTLRLQNWTGLHEVEQLSLLLAQNHP